MASHGLETGVFVAVDSGGTRTNVDMRVGTPDDPPAPLCTYEVSETLSGALPIKDIPQALRKILAPMESRLDDVEDMPLYIWISATGYSPFTRDDYLYALEDAKVDILGSRTALVGVANDATTVLLGSRADAIVIAGTGSNVMLRSANGEIHQAGGEEWVACDYGSGFWIGLRGLRDAYRDFENGRDSVLLQRFNEQYGLESGDARAIKAKVRHLAIGDKDMKKEIARFAAYVCAAAERGDKRAQDIVKAEAEDLADVTAGSLRRVFTRLELSSGVSVVQVGALLKNNFYKGSFETQLRMRLLTESEHEAAMDLQPVDTATEATLQLAQDLASQPDQYLTIDRAFRPIVLR